MKPSGRFKATTIDMLILEEIPSHSFLGRSRKIFHILFLSYRILFFGLDLAVEWISSHEIQSFQNHDSVEFSLSTFTWINFIVKASTKSTFTEYITIILHLTNFNGLWAIELNLNHFLVSARNHKLANQVYFFIITSLVH